MRLFPPPHFDDTEQERIAKLLPAILWPQTVFFVLSFSAANLIVPDPVFSRLLVMTGVVVAVMLVALLLARLGKVRAAAALNVVMVFALVSYAALTSGGVRSMAIVGYFYFILSTGVLIGWRAAVVSAVVTVPVALGFALLEISGRLPPSQISGSPVRMWFTFAFFALLFVNLQVLGRRSLAATIDKANTEIEQRKRIEERLKLSQKNMAYIAESTFEGLHIVDAGKIVKVNQNSATMFGYSLEELGAMRTSDILVFGDDVVNGVLPGDGVVLRELEGIRKDGTRFPVEVRQRPMMYYGKPMHAVAIQDLTERKRAVEEKRLHETQYKELFDSVRDAVFSLSVDGTVESLNHAFSEITGFRTEEWTGHSILELLHPGDHSAARTALEAIRRGVVTPPIEIRIRRRGGGFVTLEVVAAATFVNERVTRILGIGRDVTERKRLEEQLQRMQRLDSLGALAGSIAHDLNNVLSPVLTSVQVLRDGSSDPMAQNLLSIVEKSVKRGSDVVKQMLTFARGAENEFSAISLRGVVREIMAIVERSLPHSVHVVTDVSGASRSINGNATQIHQIVMNLCTNARDAMPAGGLLAVTVKDERIANDDAERGGVPSGEYVVITVADTGSGIPPEVRERIFEPFYTTKEPGRGTGLGLSTVQSIVKSHKAYITVDTEAGKGTAFSVYFPVIAGDGVDAGEPVEEPLPRGNGERVLVVDDEMSILEICRETLHIYGYEVSTAQNGAEAIALVASKPAGEFDLLLTDLNMPLIDGSTATSAISRMDPKIRTLTMTGTLFAHASNREPGAPPTEQTSTGRGAGDEPVLAKPFTAEALLRAVRRALQAAA